MAQLNFPARADGSSPSAGNPPVNTTFEDTGITWTWNNDLGVWSTAENSGFTQDVADGRYLRLDASAGDQTRLAGQVRFDAVTDHADGLTTGTITARSSILPIQVLAQPMTRMVLIGLKHLIQR